MVDIVYGMTGGWIDEIECEAIMSPDRAGLMQLVYFGQLETL